jgi:hypothetical protein
MSTNSIYITHIMSTDEISESLDVNVNLNVGVRTTLSDTDAGHNPRGQWDEHLSEGRSGTSTCKLWPREHSDSKRKLKRT